MTPLRVLICQQDTEVAQRLAESFSSQSHLVAIAKSPADLRDRIRRHLAQLIVLDMESAQLKDVRRLREEFSALHIVCTHRLADEKMWTAALEAGAEDVCATWDMHGILMAAARCAEFDQRIVAA